jgi:hypothetical protein
VHPNFSPLSLLNIIRGLQDNYANYIAIDFTKENPLHSAVLCRHSLFRSEDLLANIEATSFPRVRIKVGGVLELSRNGTFHTHLNLQLRMNQVDGITTIRAFGWQNKFSSRNIIELDISQSPFYLLMCLQRWLNLVLDLLVTGVAVSVISVSVVFRGTMTGGQLGVALNMILLVNTTLLSLVTLYTNLEISLGAIARLKETIQETPQESGPEEKDTIQGWPSAGAVNVQGLEVSYM